MITKAWLPEQEGGVPCTVHVLMTNQTNEMLDDIHFLGENCQKKWNFRCVFFFFFTAQNHEAGTVNWLQLLHSERQKSKLVTFTSNKHRPLQNNIKKIICFELLILFSMCFTLI